MLADRVIGPFPVLRQIDQIDEGVQLLQVLSEVQAVQLGQIHVEDRDVDLRFSGRGQGGQGIAEAEQLRLGRQLRRHLHEGRDRRFIFQYGKDRHDAPPSFGRSMTDTARSFWCCLSSLLMISGLIAPTRSMPSPDAADSCRGPALRSAITSAAKRS